MSTIQLVSNNDQFIGKTTKVFSMIDNYVYIYHTKVLVAIPTYPENLNDTMGVSFNPTTPLSRSAPIYTYQNSGPRSLEISLSLHRDMMNQINTAVSMLKVPDLSESDYVDIMINELQSIALPRYAVSEKMVDPPMVAVRFGNGFFCKGVVTGSVGVSQSGPILRTDKYAQVTVTFTVNEVDPYDAETVRHVGSYRGLSGSLEANIYRGVR